MTFDARVIEDVGDLKGWTIPDGPVRVLNGITPIGHATLKVGDDGALIATITLLGNEEAWPDGVRVGVNGQTIREHVDADGVRVADEVELLALVVG